MTERDPIEGEVTHLGRSGDGVVKTAAFEVYVRGVVPGDRVVVADVHRPRGRKVRMGRLLKVLRASPDRVDAPCDRVDRCGGCALMVMSQAAQAREKHGWVAQATGQAPARLVEGATLGYRRRARLHFAVRGARRLLGYRRASGQDIVPAAACPILRPELEAVLPWLQTTLLPLLEGAGEVSLYLGGAIAEAHEPTSLGPVLRLASQAVQGPEVFRSLEEAVQQGVLCGAALEVGGASKPAIFGQARELTVLPDGTVLEGTVGGFSQTHDEVNGALVETVVEWAKRDSAPEDVLLELYSGHGNLTIPLARAFREVHAFEASEAAVERARANLSRLGLNHARVQTRDVHQNPKTPRAEVVVLDPPRTGAGPVIPTLLKLRARTLVYVSCDHASLRRDLSALRDGGYRITDVQAFDMFPQTPHVETLVRLALD